MSEAASMLAGPNNDDDNGDLDIRVVYKEEQTGGGDQFGISHL